jgi:hypothetical protein
MDDGSDDMNLNLRECEDLIRASMSKEKLRKNNRLKTQTLKGRQQRPPRRL